MTRVGLIAVFGAIGARDLPVATLLINVVGSFALGLLVTWGAARWSYDIASALGVGFLGAFTTFSTFTVDAKLLTDDGRAGVALVYVAASVGIGLVAAFAGVALGRAIVK